MAEIGNAVGNAHDPPLERGRHPLARVVQDAVAHLIRKIQPMPAAFKDLDHAQALLVVREMPRDLLHNRLARVPERRVPDIVPERDRLRQILVQQQPARNRARDLCHLEAVRHACAVVVARDDVDLRLVLEPSERLGMENAVAIALKFRTEGALRHRMTALCISAPCRQR